MKKGLLLLLSGLSLMFAAACQDQAEEEAAVEDPSNQEDNEEVSEEANEEVDGVTSSTEQVDGTTSASVVPDEQLNTYEPNGFTDSDTEKALVVVGDPRKYSVQYDMTYTAMRFLEENDIEVEVRDLYDMDWDPVLSEEEFYYQKDGEGEPREDVAVEQELVTQADYIIFSYPNWHDTQNVMVKGYMERVFASEFAYSNDGPTGLLEGKSFFTIMNSGFLGGGRGFIGDGAGMDDEAWDEYMEAFRVLDEDTADWWGMETIGRFMNDQIPENESEEYESEIQELRSDLTDHLDQAFLQ